MSAFERQSRVCPAYVYELNNERFRATNMGMCFSCHLWYVCKFNVQQNCTQNKNKTHIFIILFLKIDFSVGVKQSEFLYNTRNSIAAERKETQEDNDLGFEEEELPF